MEAREVLDTEAARTLVSAIGQLSAPSEVEAFLNQKGRRLPARLKNQMEN